MELVKAVRLDTARAPRVQRDNVPMNNAFALLALAASLLALPAGAFKLQAFGFPQQAADGANRQTQGFLQQFRSDVHERITALAYEAAGVKLPADVVAGVRWNDNPPALRAGPLFGSCGGDALQAGEGVMCWTGMLRVDRIALEALTQRERSLAPVRSHFGDMQFLHAMAGRAGESPQETRANVTRWSEFAYRVARGEIEPKARVSTLAKGKLLDEDTAQWLGTLFRGASKRHWTVQDVFLAKASSVRAIAFGSLLHLVEDSYSAAHVRRATSRVQANGCLSYGANDAIAQFQTYVGQDTKKHGACDNAPDWLESPRPGSPVEVLSLLVRAYGDGRDWPYVRVLLEQQVFRLGEAVPAAAPGDCFEWRLTESTITPTSPASGPGCRSDAP